MLFQSYSFVLGFLPILVLLCQWLRQPHIDKRWRSCLLVAASLLFYAWLSPSSLIFLLLSCAANQAFATAIHQARMRPGRAAGIYTGLGVTLNILGLSALKFSEELGWLAIPSDYFPLGVSFITFLQIIYLVETFNGSLRKLSGNEYLQIATFLGYITSGPVVSPAELTAQQDDPEERNRRLDAEHLLAGAALFAIGLFKKLVIADSLAPYGSTIFMAAQQGITVSSSDAWLGACVYMLQLYFDFSGYSDMAIGIGYLVGVRLPLNFNSPFKAVTVMDYWRRWHMTLTRFITNYLYLPVAVMATRWIAGKKIEAEVPRFLLSVAVPTLIAFIVAGVWHGNGWTFLAYGLYWGVALSVYQAWSRYCSWRMPLPTAWALTMATALISLVIFRSQNLNVATAILLTAPGLRGGSSNLLPPTLGAAVLALSAALIWLPNSQQILNRYRISSDEVAGSPPALVKWTWSATPAGAAFLGVTLVAALLMGGGPTQFMYYKF